MRLMMMRVLRLRLNLSVTAFINPQSKRFGQHQMYIHFVYDFKATYRIFVQQAYKIMRGMCVYVIYLHIYNSHYIEYMYTEYSEAIYTSYLLQIDV